MNPFRLITFLLLTSASLLAAPALKDGESFNFRVSWGPLGHAGDIRINAADQQAENGQPLTAVKVRTSTEGLAGVLFPFEGMAESVFDADDGRILNARAWTKARNKRTDATIIFDHESGAAAYTDNINPKRNTTLSIPSATAMDLITSLVAAGEMDLQPGEERPVSVLFDNEFYDLTLKAERFETVKTAFGKKDALLVIPSMPKNPKGMFRKGGEIRVWLARSQDDRQLPLRFEVKLKVGTATALLTRYVPPAAPQIARAP